ncbi:unnamed protein product [Fusarium graminearum]|uniref:Chromosome 2, complete genome n=2 Tax=Gibberella zeae TaxID=5518 RepID=A0A098DD76_GIBZE|nr:unnamed protein product [Fusarium graminearum]CAF3483383.1 unnamed protein product [Fusarium graminearum]CAF3496108.1 unnamed protein product [Fusarium graminearum]CAG1976023.1 unnamed protein product [Fusarium graminearum]CAG1977110.1 unnamed protein product [Fusarium graminearum]
MEDEEGSRLREEAGLDKDLRIEGEQGEGWGKQRRVGRREPRDAIGRNDCVCNADDCVSSQSQSNAHAQIRIGKESGVLGMLAGC